MTMNKKPVFIHSLFRTGSTYVWNKFRQDEKYYCYYEPLHQVLAKITPENIEYMLTRDYESVNHPKLDRYYLYEYKPLLKEGATGIPHFKKSFSFDEFCENDKNPDFKQYIDYLIAGAGDKIPVLQFNRSAFRVKWFKENYPGSLNIYLVRQPHDQWKSYFELYNRTTYGAFFVMDLLIASMNKDKKGYRLLSENLPLLTYRNDTQDKEENFYRVILDSYSKKEKYFIFYYTWFKALFENVLYADFIMNINLLSNNPSYREKVTGFLKNRGLEGITFEDARLKEYASYPLPVKELTGIEEAVRDMILRSLPGKQIDHFLRKIPQEDRNYFRFNDGDFKKKDRGKAKPGGDISEETIGKLQEMIKVFADEYFVQDEKNRAMENLLKDEDSQVIKELELKANLLNQKKRVINQKDLLVAEKDKQLELKDKYLNQKERELEKLDPLLTEKEKQIRKHEEMLIRKKHEIEQQELLLADKDKQIVKKDQEIKDRKMLLGVKEKQMKQQDEVIGQKTEELEKRDLLLANTNKRLKQKNHELNQHKIQLSKIRQQLAISEFYSRRILNSYAYRAGKTVTFPLRTAKKLLSKSFNRVSISYHHAVKEIVFFIKRYEKKVNLSGELNADFGRHRCGWSYVVQVLKDFHNPGGTVLDTFIERTFFWHPEGVRPHLEPWIGFIHVPPKIPHWFHYEQANKMLFKNELWKKSLPHCRGLYTLSNYHRKNLKAYLDIPINNLLFPTEIPEIKWSWEKFTANREKKIVQVGWWLRKLHAIFQLPPSGYKKIFLSVEHKSMPELMEKEREILKKEGTFNGSMYNTAETVTYLPDKVYDRLLSENIVFVYLYDASANNTVIECIVRNTPLLVNPIEPVKEYLGEDYPFYYNSYEEAASKAANLDLIYKTYQFLRNHPIKKKLTQEYFLDSFANSRIYRSLKV
jgi:hypothetical protein